MKFVYNFLENLNINKEDNIIVAVSYGPDSMMLLDVIKNFYKENKITCAHVHHNHRKESDMEALELESYCKKKDITFEMMKIKEYKNNKFTEEEARNKRYEFFDELMTKYESKYLFTAHHGDDLVETILMRLSRGSSLKGYSGISLMSKRSSYNLVRPLLFVTKEDVLIYCKANNISYAVDKSNLDNDYTRNRYRNKILPLLKEENKSVHTQYLKFSTVLQETEEFVHRITLNLYDTVVNNEVMDLNILLKQDEYLMKRVLMLFLSNYYKDNITSLNDTHINLILDLIRNNKTNDKISLPNKINLVKSYNKLYFDNNDCYNNYCFLFEDYIKLPNGYIIEKVNSLDNTTNYVAAFNSRDISLPLYVRNKKDGDKIEILGLNGSKKIKDIFIDEKIDVSLRKNYPVLADSLGNILWLPGIKKSKYDKSKKENYDIILKYYKEDSNDRTNK